MHVYAHNMVYITCITFDIWWGKEKEENENEMTENPETKWEIRIPGTVAAGVAREAVLWLH